MERGEKVERGDKWIDSEEQMERGEDGGWKGEKEEWK